MRKLESRKEVNALIILFVFTYMVSYITRINYGAIISEMEKETGFARNLLSMALTGSFITYGVGQIISGICGDRFSPKKLVSCGLTLTVIMNLFIPLCNNPYLMTVVWCVNGFAQSLMWPPLVRIMATLLSEEDYKNASSKVSWGGNFGTIAVYTLSPLLISVLGWKSVFVFSSLCGAAMIFIWNKYSYEIDKEPRKTNAPKKDIKVSSVFNILMISIMIAIILQGMLRDGVTTWMPSYISETYNISNIISILTGVVLPIFGIICIQFATKLYIKKFTNPMTCAGVFFGGGAMSALILLFVTGKNAALSVLFSSLLTGCMHGVNLIIICMIPPFFQKDGIVSTVSGILNSCTYIGSAVSTYGIAVLSKNVGWTYTLILWLLIAVLGTAVCMLCVKPWEKKVNSVSNKEMNSF
ncbi:MAG: MFS transporter [Clostridia bacterium]|nr:MFS transporter [Clostridia bacterium]